MLINEVSKCWGGPARGLWAGLPAHREITGPYPGTPNMLKMRDKNIGWAALAGRAGSTNIG
jgi:hypothetical protein